MRIATALPLVLLAACSPQAAADAAVRRAAGTVILPVVDDTMTAAQAEGVTRCVLDNTAPADLRLIARDVGVVAGTLTRARVLAAAARPAARACIDASRLPRPPEAAA
jgi:hypothetical protein